MSPSIFLASAIKAICSKNERVEACLLERVGDNGSEFATGAPTCEPFALPSSRRRITCPSVPLEYALDASADFLPYSGSAYPSMFTEPPDAFAQLFTGAYRAPPPDVLAEPRPAAYG